MSFGAKGQQTLDVAYHGTLWADTNVDRVGVPFYANISNRGSIGSFSSVGGSASVSCATKFATGPGGIGTISGTDNAAIRSAIDAWWAAYGTGMTHGAGYVWIISSNAPNPPDGNHDYAYEVVGWVTKETIAPPNPATYEYSFHGVTEIEVDWTIGMTNAYRRADTTDTPPTGYASLRHPCQRSGEARWYADENTEVVVTCGETSTSGNFGVLIETDLTTSAALGLTSGINYTTAPATGTAYIIGTANAGTDDDPVVLNFDHWTFYQDTDSASWHWHGVCFGGSDPPAAANIKWQTVPSGNSITIHRGAAVASGAVTWSEEGLPAMKRVAPRLWKQNKLASGATGYEQYTEYDDSEGHPFDLNLYRHYTWDEGAEEWVQQSEADVSVAPIFSGYYEYTQMQSLGIEIPDDAWCAFSEPFTVHIRGDWMEANNEVVPFTEPVGMVDYPYTLSGITYTKTDIRVPITFHDLITPLLSSPYKSDWIEFVRTELNLDKPPGADDTRPSDWEGLSGATVVDDTWSISATACSVSRTLKTRRRNRCRRISAHLWTGSGDQQEVTYLWLIATKANLPIEVTLDDAKWWDPEAEPWSGDEVGCTYEDITDWRQIWNVKLTCTGATQDIPLQLRVRYRELDAYAPWYTGAYWNFGGEGEAYAIFGDQKERIFEGVLSSSTGICTFDLMPDVGVQAPVLELVEEIAFIFPDDGVEQELTFVGFETIPYVYGSYVEGTGNVMDRIALKFKTDYFGARSYVDGCPNYRPTYGYTMDQERASVGFKNTQDLQHNPDYEGERNDLRSLKTLYGMYGEMAVAQLIMECVWYQANVDSCLTDEDDNVLAVPLWADYDEDGSCLHVGKVTGDTFPGAIHYADFILQGGVRGVVKAAGVRSPMTTDAVELYYSDDGGTNKTLIRAASTDSTGAFNVGTGREKSPRTYYLYINETWIDVGSFVNVEEGWENGGIPQVIDLYTVLDRYGFVHRFYIINDRVVKVKTRPKNGSIQSTITVATMEIDTRAVSAEELQGLLRVYTESEVGLLNVFESKASELRDFVEVFG